MSRIEIEGMRFHAFHGCFPEEQIVGNTCQVDLWLWVDTRTAEATDDVNDTLNYQRAYELVASEMGIPSKILEHVGTRILGRLFGEFPSLDRARVRVQKLHPAMGGEVESVGVTLERGRDE